MIKQAYPRRMRRDRSCWPTAASMVAKYAMPYDIEFREELPKTLVGKVAYRVLEEEELAKLKAEQKPEAQVQGGGN